MPDAVSPAFSRLVELLIGARVALALRSAAERRVADFLADGSKSIETLASDTGLPVDTLRRLLRGLAALGVFAESADGRFSNTEVSEYMRDGATPSLREMILVLNDDAVLDGWRQFPAVLKSGAPAFPAANGMNFFDYIARDPKRSEWMGKFMTGVYGPEAGKIASGYPFDRFGSLLDVGGAQGLVLTKILERHTHIKGALFDLPRTADVARGFLASRGFGNCEVFAGDFFESLPAGFDAYFLKAVLHDWDDEAAGRILRSCREAMPEQGRLLVCEMVVEPGKALGHPHRLIDLEMLVTFGGKERTADEYKHLLEAAGLKLQQITPIENSFVSIVEASRA